MGIRNDGVANGIHFTQHFIIPKSQNPKTKFLQSHGSLSIMHGISMLAAVDFDDQHGICAQEISYI